MDDYLSKPVLVSDIAEMIKKYLDPKSEGSEVLNEQTAIN